MIRSFLAAAMKTLLVLRILNGSETLFDIRYKLCYGGTYDTCLGIRLTTLTCQYFLRLEGSTLIKANLKDTRLKHIMSDVFHNFNLYRMFF